VLTVEQVAFAASDEGRTPAGFDSAMAHEYVLVGKVAIEPMPGGVLIHDRAIDALRLGAVRDALARVTVRLGRAYGVTLARPVGRGGERAARHAGFPRRRDGGPHDEPAL
jgi:hypothetical protein